MPMPKPKSSNLPEPEPQRPSPTGQDETPPAHGTASAVGRALAALRRKYVRTCALPGCDVQFEGTARRRYCSNRHAALAGWHRRQAAKRQDQESSPTTEPPR
jgi:hypothetical protein